MAKKRGQLQFRYYEIPNGEPLLALLGERWIRPYGYDQNEEPIQEQHFHNLLEIGYCYRGSGIISLEDQVYPYADGTITLIPRNYPHNTNAERGKHDRWEYLFVDVERTLPLLYPDGRRYLPQMKESLGQCVLCTSARQYPELGQIILSILEEMRGHRPMYEEKVRALLRVLFVEVTRLYQEKGRRMAEEEDGEAGFAAEPKQEWVPKNPMGNGCQKMAASQEQIGRALEFIAANYMHPIRVGALSDLCHMSESHFRRVFLRSMGMTPADFVNQMRIKKACDLLQKTNESISDVAGKCGFSSLATFHRNFRSYTGMTPSECRNQPEAFERRIREKSIFVYDGWS